MELCFQPMPVECSPQDPAFIEVVSHLAGAKSLEEIIYNLISSKFKISFTVIPEGEGILSLIIENPVKKILCVPIPMPYLRRVYKYKPISQGIYPLADKPNALTIDDEFLDRRDLELKLKYDGRKGLGYGQVTSLVPLLLSYADAGVGFVIATQDFNLIKTCPEKLIRLDLVHIPDGSDSAMAREDFYFSLKRMGTILAKRKMRREGNTH